MRRNAGNWASTWCAAIAATGLCGWFLWACFRAGTSWKTKPAWDGTEGNVLPVRAPVGV